MKFLAAVGPVSTTRILSQGQYPLVCLGKGDQRSLNRLQDAPALL